MQNKTYDKLKTQVMITLPALATLYFALSQIWSLPFGPQVVATITAITTFLGVVLRVEGKKYAAKEEDIPEDEVEGEIYMP